MNSDSQVREAGLWGRVARFARRPYHEQRTRIALRWIKAFPRVPFPIRLPGGQWWLMRDNYEERGILQGAFEQRELRFVESYLREGMTVLDIGAHHGLYTLLAARKVGRTGRVVAFEPSPRERRCLSWNLRVNRCSNVKIEPLALGASEGRATLFVVDGKNTGCNSLRSPSVTERTVEQSVEVRRLDQVLRDLGIQRVDFIKLDAEGAELSILSGAGDLVTKSPRPAILAEVYDIRTHPWGYDAREIIRFLADRGYTWFRLLEDGRIEPIRADRWVFDDNFVAVPQEKVGLPLTG